MERDDPIKVKYLATNSYLPFIIVFFKTSYWVISLKGFLLMIAVISTVTLIRTFHNDEFVVVVMLVFYV